MDNPRRSGETREGMAGRAANSPAQDGRMVPALAISRGDPGPLSSTPVTDPDRRRELGLLVVLLLAAVGIRVWHLTHTEVAARDSIGYIRYAWQLRHHPWADVIRKSEPHPGYPLAILAVSEVVRRAVPGPECITMQLSAQLANALAGVLLVVPMFYLGRELFNRAVGFWAALLFQCLPASGRVLSDGLSEGLFLLFAAAALASAVRALRRHTVTGFALTGLFAGLSYLTRPEGALTVAATGLVLLGAQAVPAWRRSWRRTLVGAAGLGLAAVLVAGPFIAVTQRFTTKPTAHRVLEAAGFRQMDESTPEVRSSRADDRHPLLATLAIWQPDPDAGGPERTRWGLFALIMELAKATYYIGWLPALGGLWWSRDRLRQVPGAWVVLLVFVGLAAILWRMAVVVGYLSDRHTLLLLLCIIYWSAAGLLFVGGRLAALLARFGAPVGGLAPGMLVLALIGAALPKTLEPLHANRSGFRQAGLWLAEHAAPTDPVIDPYYWSHYYAGRVFTEGAAPAVPPGHQSVRYVVLERGASEHVRLRLLPEAERLKDQGRIVYRWSGRRPRGRAEIFIYAVPP